MNKFISLVAIISICLFVSTYSQASSLRTKSNVMLIKKNQLDETITNLRPDGEFEPDIDCEYLTLLDPPHQYVCEMADTKCKNVGDAVYLITVVITTRPECESTGGTVM